MLAILGILLAVIGLLGLVGLLAVPLVGSILLIVGGVLLIAYDRRGNLRF